MGSAENPYSGQRHAINLSPGDQIHFERELAGRSVRTSARFIGKKGRDYILTEPPVINGKPLFTSVGSPCVVRYMDNGIIYGFVSTVAFIQYNPFPMVYINHPHKVERINLRREGRFAVLLPTHIHYRRDGREQAVEGSMVDLSRSGCRLTLPILFDVGNVLLLSFGLGDGLEVTRSAAQVRNVRSLNSHGYELGVSFEEENPSLQEYVIQLRAMRKSKVLDCPSLPVCRDRSRQVLKDGLV